MPVAGKIGLSPAQKSLFTRALRLANSTLARLRQLIRLNHNLSPAAKATINQRIELLEEKSQKLQSILGGKKPIPSEAKIKADVKSIEESNKTLVELIGKYAKELSAERIPLQQLRENLRAGIRLKQQFESLLQNLARLNYPLHPPTPLLAIRNASWVVKNMIGIGAEKPAKPEQAKFIIPLSALSAAIAKGASPAAAAKESMRFHPGSSSSSGLASRLAAALVLRKIAEKAAGTSASKDDAALREVLIKLIKELNHWLILSLAKKTNEKKADEKREEAKAEERLYEKKLEEKKAEKKKQARIDKQKKDDAKTKETHAVEKAAIKIFFNETTEAMQIETNAPEAEIVQAIASISRPEVETAAKTIVDSAAQIIAEQPDLKAPVLRLVQNIFQEIVASAPPIAPRKEQIAAAEKPVELSPIPTQTRIAVKIQSIPLENPDDIRMIPAPIASALAHPIPTISAADDVKPATYQPTAENPVKPIITQPLIKKMVSPTTAANDKTESPLISPLTAQPTMQTPTRAPVVEPLPQVPVQPIQAAHILLAAPHQPPLAASKAKIAAPPAPPAIAPKETVHEIVTALVSELKQIAIEPLPMQDNPRYASIRAALCVVSEAALPVLVREFIQKALPSPLEPIITELAKTDGGIQHTLNLFAEAAAPQKPRAQAEAQIPAQIADAAARELITRATANISPLPRPQTKDKTALRVEIVRQLLRVNSGRFTKGNLDRPVTPQEAESLLRFVAAAEKCFTPHAIRNIDRAAKKPKAVFKPKNVIRIRENAAIAASAQKMFVAAKKSGLIIPQALIDNVIAGIAGYRPSAPAVSPLSYFAPPAESPNRRTLENLLRALEAQAARETRQISQISGRKAEAPVQQKTLTMAAQTLLTGIIARLVNGNMDRAQRILEIIKERKQLKIVVDYLDGAKTNDSVPERIEAVTAFASEIIVSLDSRGAAKKAGQDSYLELANAA